MRHAALLLIILTVGFNPPCGATMLPEVNSGNAPAGYHALTRALRGLMLCGVLFIFLLSGCTKYAANPAPPAPVVMPLAPCPAPAAPALPAVDGETAFDSPGNVRALLDRDSVLRRYIAGLRAALVCYEQQVEATHD